VLEALAGRAHNLGCAAYLLLCRGLYDESLNLIRSIGEISNLILLSVVDKESFRRWLSADSKSRRRDFSPVKVRLLLEKHSTIPMPVDEDWYSELCEKYSHVTPGTSPNMHSDDRLRRVGGMLQPHGLAECAGQLAMVLVPLALMVSRYVNLADTVAEIEAALALARAGDHGPSND
jgi:hypothetical protein